MTFLSFYIYFLSRDIRDIWAPHYRGGPQILGEHFRIWLTSEHVAKLVEFLACGDIRGGRSKKKN